MLSPDPILIEVDALDYSIKSKLILSEINFKILRGEWLTIIGPNGAGKSTLLKLILGLLKASRGHIKVAADLRLGYMPQKLSLNPLLPIRVQHFLQSSAVDLRAVTTLFERLQIDRLLQSELIGLSGGELQRVLLARALIRQPQLLILDEPAQGVDIQGQAELYQLLKELREERQCAIVMVSHDLHWVMSGTARVLCLNKHICCTGEPKEISQNPEFIQMFGRASPWALYTHTHQHRHDLRGEPCN